MSCLPLAHFWERGTVGVACPKGLGVRAEMCVRSSLSGEMLQRGGYPLPFTGNQPTRPGQEGTRMGFARNPN